MIVSCGGTNSAGTRVGNPITTTAEAFPQGLAISSPLLTTDSSSNLTQFLTTDSDPLGAVDYDDFSTEIENMLTSSDLQDCVPDLSLFLNNSTNAACYGPQIIYENHPDGDDGDQLLPSGDVGIWLENEDNSTEACGAAQLNARMIGVSDKSYAAMQVLASGICVANNNSISFVGEGTTVDLTTEMNNLSTTYSMDATFSNATISESTNTDGDTVYTYDVSLTYVSDSTSIPMQISMIHVASDGTTSYSGRMNFKFNESDYNGGDNCALVTTDVTQAGSLLYNKSSDTSLNFEYRSAVYCGHDQDPFTNGIVDPSKKLDTSTFSASSDENGWGDNYNLFIADFDPTTGDGNYTYAWQAGRNDSHTRVFNVYLTTTELAATSVQTGVSFFGYGPESESSGGSISGFICNWAGPGANHSTYIVERAQKQVMTYNSTTNVFESDSDQLQILYAPTNSCDATSSFTYDTDADDDLTDEAPTTVTHDLADLTNVSDSGFVLPTAPDNVE